MPRSERQGEQGIALLEAMVAVAVLASAGAALVGVLGQAIYEEHELRDRERLFRAADRVLVATTLLKRADLDRRLGRHEVGEFLVEVQRPRPMLYRIAVSETRTEAVEMLVTVVYRPESDPQ